MIHEIHMKHIVLKKYKDHTKLDNQAKMPAPLISHSNLKEVPYTSVLIKHSTAMSYKSQKQTIYEKIIMRSNAISRLCNTAIIRLYLI